MEIFQAVCPVFLLSPNSPQNGKLENVVCGVPALVEAGLLDTGKVCNIAVFPEVVMGAMLASAKANALSLDLRLIREVYGVLKHLWEM